MRVPPLICVAVFCAISFAEESRVKVPIFLEGDRLKGKQKEEDTFEKDSPKSVTRKVTLPMYGVWYVWLKVTSNTDRASLLTYDLDGIQPLHSARAQILVHPNTKSQWIHFSRHPGWQIELYADQPGEHILGIQLLQGDVTIEKIALTLYHSATLKGDKIDHTNDPTRGVIDFSVSQQREGYRSDSPSPPIRATGKTYYVDSKTGSDTNDGLSEGKPWKTFQPVNPRRFDPGDAILLRRGQRWDESLAPQGNGTQENGIHIGAYGEGKRPFINGHHRPAVSLIDQSHWTIQDIEATSDPQYEQSAIAVIATKETPQPKAIRIINCVAFDNGAHGIHVGSEWEKTGNGYDGVVIENCLTFANDGDGIVVGGLDQNGCRNTVIRHCTAFSNAGMAGIWIQSGQNGLIEHCLGYNNACINIWTWNSINVTIRYCEAFRGRPQRDAGGFDIDWGCEACTMEFCYSHHNEGVGFLIMGSGGEQKRYRGFPIASMYNIMRYCVSEYNGGEEISMIETFNYGKIYNNTVVGRGKNKTVFDVSGWPDLPEDGKNGGWPTQCDIFNNIIVAEDDATPLWVDDYATRLGNVFDHNLFWRIGKRGPLVRWAGRKNGPKFWEGDRKTGSFPPDNYATLDAFRKATQQEKNGIHADPLLRSIGRGGYGRLPLDAYQLLHKSPATDAGRSVPLSDDWLKARAKFLTDTGAESYGIPMHPAPVTEDYWGKKLGDKIPIGVGR